MTTPLSFNFLPHRREFLETSIGMRLRADFAYNSYTPIPKVRLYSPDEARADGFDPNRGLGWFNFKTGDIGVLVFNDRAVGEAWQMATGVTVHEHLHWLWSVSPKTVGCLNESDRFVMNVFTDAANEQRGQIVSRWTQKFLRRTRQILLPQAWAGDVKEPLYRAGHFTLAVHTLLSVKGGRIMRRLHKTHQPETMAKDLWTLCEKEFNRKMPEDEMDIWLKAFGLSLRAWTADSDFTRFSIAQEFIALFPQPVDSPPDSPLDMGGHLNDDCERADDPAGSSKSGKPITNSQNASSSQTSNRQDDSPGEDSAADSQKDERGEDKSGDGSNDSPAAPIDEGRDENGDGKESSSENSAPLSFDETPIPDKDEKSELEQIEQETRELNRPSRALPGAVVTRFPSDAVSPADPRVLIADSQTDANALAERLRIVARPRGRVQAAKGRVVSRIVAFDPTAQKPFRNRVSPVKGFDPQVFVALVADTSGSMRNSGKAKAARAAAMTVHLACVREKVNHWIATSRTLELLAGNQINFEKGNALIAGMKPHTSGDNYTDTLPKLIALVLKRPESVKILLVLTDGMPGEKERLAPVIASARQKGITVVGIGLELNEQEIAGMKLIFGNRPDQTVIAGSPGFARLTAEVLSNAATRGFRSRFFGS